MPNDILTDFEAFWDIGERHVLLIYVEKKN